MRNGGFDAADQPQPANEVVVVLQGNAMTKLITKPLRLWAEPRSGDDHADVRPRCLDYPVDRAHRCRIDEELWVVVLGIDRIQNRRSEIVPLQGPKIHAAVSCQLCS